MNIEEVNKMMDNVMRGMGVPRKYLKTEGIKMNKKLMSAARQLNRTRRKINEMTYLEAKKAERKWGKSLDKIEEWENDLVELAEILWEEDSDD